MKFVVPLALLLTCFTTASYAEQVNDRGPFTPGVTVDLSSGAARAVGMRSTQNVMMSRC